MNGKLGTHSFIQPIDQPTELHSSLEIEQLAQSPPSASLIG